MVYVKRRFSSPSIGQKDTVYPEFYENLSSTRKSNSVFPDFSGWVYMRLQDFIARQSSHHEEDQEDNLNDDGMQNRLHSHLGIGQVMVQRLSKKR